MVCCFGYTNGKQPGHVLCKVELVSDKLGCLAKEISKQSGEGVIWFFHDADSKTQKNWDKLHAVL